MNLRLRNVSAVLGEQELAVNELIKEIQQALAPPQNALLLSAMNMG